MKRFFICIVLLFVIIPIFIPLFNKGFFQSDDGEWMIIRFSAFHQALAQGQFPVRWTGRLNHEYGYPVVNFLYPGFLYLSEPIYLLVRNFTYTIKIVIALSLFGSFIFTYLWLSKLFRKLAAYVGGFVFLYAPYHLFDAYKRGSVGELLALAVVPFILWQIERKSFFFSVLGVSFLILSHNSLAMLFLPIIIAYAGIRAKFINKPLVLYIPLGLALSLGIAAFFWIPALVDLQYTVFAETTISKWQEYFADSTLVGIGIIIIFIASFTLFLIMILKRKLPFISFNAAGTYLFYFFLFLGMLSIFFATEISAPLWTILPISFIQFPFRILAIEILCAAFLTAYCIDVCKNNIRVASAIITVFIFIFFALPFTNPIGYINNNDTYYATNMDTTTVKNEYMPKWAKQIPQKRKEEKILLASGILSEQKITSRHVSFTANTKESTTATIFIHYFPGWEAKINNRKSDIVYNNPEGVMRLDLPQGNNNVILSFVETPLRLFSDGISLISLAMLCGLAYKFKQQSMKKI